MWNVSSLISPTIRLAILCLAIPILSGCKLKVMRDDAALVLSAGSAAIGTSLSLQSVFPANGPFTGNTTITITGTAFQSGVTVQVGGAPCVSVIVVSETQLTCTTPASSIGWQDIVVELGTGATATLASAFLFEPDLASVGAAFIVSAGAERSTSSDGIGIIAIESVGVELDPIHQASTEVQNLYGPQGVFYTF